MFCMYLTYSIILLCTIYPMRFESPNRDRTMVYIESTHRRHIHIRMDKNVLLFGNHFPGIYLVYTRYILAKVYTIWILAAYDVVGHLRYRRSVTTTS